MSRHPSSIVVAALLLLCSASAAEARMSPDPAAQPAQWLSAAQGSAVVHIGAGGELRARVVESRATRDGEPLWRLRFSHVAGALRPIWLSSDGRTLLLARGPSDYSKARELLLISAGEQVAAYPLLPGQPFAPVLLGGIDLGVGVFDGAAFAVRDEAGGWHHFGLPEGEALESAQLSRLKQAAGWGVWKHCLELSGLEAQTQPGDLPRLPDPLPDSGTIVGVLTSASDAWTRQCALRIAAAIEDSDALNAALLAAVNDNDTAVRAFTLGLLVRAPAETARQIVRALRRDPAALIRSRVEHVAWDVAREGAVKLTLEGIRKGDHQAFAMAGFKRVREARPLLLEAAEAGGENEHRAFRALHSMKKKGDFESLAPLVASARNPEALLWGLRALRALDEQTRRHRIRERGIGCSAVPRLEKALRSGELATARSAARALALVGCDAATVALVRSLKPGRGNTRTHKDRLDALLKRRENGAAAALRILAEHDTTPDGSRPRIRRWLDRLDDRRRTRRCHPLGSDPFALDCSSGAK